MLLQRVDKWHLAHVLGQVAFFDQASQGVSGCGFRVAEDGGGFFDGDLRIAGSQVHTVQELCLVGGQLVSGEGGIDHALLENIQHIADERGEVQPLAVGILDGFLRILQGAVIAVDPIVDGVGQGQALHLFPACVIQGGGIDDPGGPAVAVAEGVDIDEIEVGDEGTDQALILLPETEPLLHQVGEPLRRGGRMDGSGSTSDLHHAGPIGFAVEMGILTYTLRDPLPESTKIFPGNGTAVGVVAATDGVDHHFIILADGLCEAPLDFGHGCSGSLDGSGGPGIQNHIIRYSTARGELIVHLAQLCGPLHQLGCSGQI